MGKFALIVCELCVVLSGIAPFFFPECEYSITMSIIYILIVGIGNYLMWKLMTGWYVSCPKMNAKMQWIVGFGSATISVVIIGGCFYVFSLIIGQSVSFFTLSLITLINVFDMCILLWGIEFIKQLRIKEEEEFEKLNDQED